jgi:segregation and condensation protein A
VLARFAEEAGRSYPRLAGLEEQFLHLQPDLLAGITPGDLHAAFQRASAPRPEPRVDLTHVAPVRLSVAEAVEELADELPRVGRITFRRLTSDLVERLEVIVRFLAVLELYKQGLVELEQTGTFGEIEIEWSGPDEGGAELALAGIDTYEG